jgi:hypothetical protein
MDIRAAAIDEAIARKLTASDVGQMSYQEICDLAGIDPKAKAPVGWCYESVRAVVANTLRSKEQGDRLESARIAAEKAAREVLPDAIVEVRV